MKKYTLAFECPERLDRMKITPEGYHCGVCDKQVVDFRGKNAQEIQLALTQQVTPPCAVFRRSQFRTPFLRTAVLATFSLSLGVAGYAQSTDKKLGNEGPPPPNIRLDKVADVNQITDNPVIGPHKSLTSNHHTFPALEDLGELEEIDEEVLGEPVLGWISEERFATPEGGMDAYYQALAEAIEPPSGGGCMEGRIYIQFVVEKTGETSQHEVIRGVSEAWGQAVLQAFESLGILWTPGMQGGEKVRSKMIIPVSIKLQ
ncbi:MAG: energy transducer TonB [Bacteroidota bacterium]